jgi:hypothetical protein
MTSDCADGVPSVKRGAAGGRAVDGLSASRVSPSTGRLILAVVLLGYGLYRALYVPGLILASDALLLVLFVLQAVSGIVAGIGVARRAAWAPVAIVVLGVSVAATAFIEGFVLGIAPWLFALLRAVLAVVLALVAAAYVRNADA